VTKHKEVPLHWQMIEPVNKEAVFEHS